MYSFSHHTSHCQGDMHCDVNLIYLAYSLFFFFFFLLNLGIILNRSSVFKITIQSKYKS